MRSNAHAVACWSVTVLSIILYACQAGHRDYVGTYTRETEHAIYTLELKSNERFVYTRESKYDAARPITPSDRTVEGEWKVADEEEFGARAVLFTPAIDIVTFSLVRTREGDLINRVLGHLYVKE